MHLRFQKRIKILPGLRINLSKSGISLTAGAGPLHLNIGKRGPMVTASLPGTGVSFRHKIPTAPMHSKVQAQKTSNSASAHPPPLPTENWNRREIKSRGINELTSTALQEVHDHFQQAARERGEIRSQISEAEQNHSAARGMLESLQMNASDASYGDDHRKRQEWENYAQELGGYIANLNELLEETSINSEVEIDPEIVPLFEELLINFLAIAQEAQIWDETAINRVTRSGKASSLKHGSEIRKVDCSISQLELIQCQSEVPYLGNANGGDLYFYPGFLVIYYSNEEFALIGFDEIEARLSSIQSPGCDAYALDQSQSAQTTGSISDLGDRPWARIEFRTETGLHESFLVENFDAAERFHASIVRLLAAFRPKTTLEPDLRVSEIESIHGYECPGRDIFDLPDLPEVAAVKKEELLATADKIVETLRAFGVRLTPEQISRGHRFTLYEFTPEPGYPISRLNKFAPDIAIATESDSVRILAPIPGRITVGVELVSRPICPVAMSDLLSDDIHPCSEMGIPLALGLDVTGTTHYADLHEMPNLLIAGTTGSGKTVWINSQIGSLLFRFRPDELKLTIIDLDGAGTSTWSCLPHLFGCLSMDPIQGWKALSLVEQELARRTSVLAESRCRSIKEFNRKHAAGIRNLEGVSSELNVAEKLSSPPIPYLIVIVDGISCLMKSKKGEAESLLSSIASRGAACGIHLIASAQSLDNCNFSKVFMDHFESRIAFQTSSAAESRNICNTAGAESLSGDGDMLFFKRLSSSPIRLQAAQISDSEMTRIANFCSVQSPAIDANIESIIDSMRATGDAYPEELIQQCMEVVHREGRCTTSLLQRKLRLGYTRASALVEILKQRGVIGS